MKREHISMTTHIHFREEIFRVKSIVFKMRTYWCILVWQTIHRCDILPPPSSFLQLCSSQEHIRISLCPSLGTFSVLWNNFHDTILEPNMSLAEIKVTYFMNFITKLEIVNRNLHVYFHETLGCITKSTLGKDAK